MLLGAFRLIRALVKDERKNEQKNELSHFDSLFNQALRVFAW